ncbi:MAG: SufD family Fe-S cluster assembly protein [Thermoanaerobacterales bacterium]|nr:SufD family Fe-S cluster assembly protein [Bacillota bacterium]MDI6905884.1 SufD family Fe-S cluster assembly protein [Thermoanaerobacterales bacterium]
MRKDERISPHAFKSEAPRRVYLDDPRVLRPEDSRRMLSTGVDVTEEGRIGTYIQMDHSVVHCHVKQDGLDVMSTTEAAERYPWLVEYRWRLVQADRDEYNAYARDYARHGYFIRALPGMKVTCPLQACLYIAADGITQAVHNIVVVEEGAELNLVSGCASAHDVRTGMHIGISEFYVKRGAKLTFTMIHNWGEKMQVRPRSAALVEAGGVFLSNYVCLQAVDTLQMYPMAYLDGPGATARFHSILAAPPGSLMDVGAGVVLRAPDTRAESIARAITTGGDVISRGRLVGEVAGVKAHLECRGLILAERGLIHAIPELEARVAGAEMSHEAAVGKIAPEEIEYLTARGLNEEEATATIVRGFLNVRIEGLPRELQDEIDRAIAAGRESIV